MKWNARILIFIPFLWISRAECIINLVYLEYTNNLKSIILD